ncbi:hypothetical protein CPB84DRAFT_1752626 [Gymnopilus junonius]|uniref:Uncharacterized protein n=1 Tax=Gymnopilus junonius TaxID=109634 RepID=A0A9P5THH0_GYMJU|nr:hypothetical protein CPB84DRAFT_1752626 [Gymnopilus junonius]
MGKDKSPIWNYFIAGKKQNGSHFRAHCMGCIEGNFCHNPGYSRQPRAQLVRSRAGWRKEMNKWIQKEQESDLNGDGENVDAFADGQKEPEEDEQMRCTRRRVAYTEEERLIELMADEAADVEGIPDDGNPSIDVLNKILAHLDAIEQAQETNGHGRAAKRKSNAPENSESPEPEEGSSFKGKGVDPLNWGNIEIPENELDPEVQCALHQQAAKKAAAEKFAKASCARAIKPSSQTHPDSLLDAGGNSNDYLSSDEDGLGSTFMSLLMRGQSSEVVHHKLLVPTPPDKHSRKADMMKYYKFITQCKRFCKKAALPPDIQALKCAGYLDGKAYTWYSSIISFEIHHYSLHTFLIELFNYYFPPDY